MDLQELISTGSPIVLDGAMGTELATAGLEMGGRNCISHPAAVLAIHRRYLDAGCDAITTNTLTMNRISVETHSMDVDVKAVNIAGARLARSAVGDARFVLGDISSTGQLLEPYGDWKEEQFIETFREQASYLLAGGVDGFMIETVIDVNEAVCAVKGCRELSSLPVVASLSFQTVEKGGRTAMGSIAADSARALVDAGATVVGANCGTLDPRETAAILRMMREAADVPLAAQPNAGRPRLVEGRTVFDMSPDDFAEGLLECMAAGATLLGGCCGTSPGHIGALARAIRG